MLYFAYHDHKSLKDGIHTDLKSVIISIGVLGTFVGIAIGLWEFDTKSIDDSVPKLLEGLKLAFATSIVGMLISIILSGMQKNKISGGNDELSVLSEINAKLSNLEHLEQISRGFDGLRLEIREEHKQTKSMIELYLSKSLVALTSIDTKVDGIATTEAINKFRVDVHEEQLKSRLFLEDQMKIAASAIDDFKSEVNEEQVKSRVFLEDQFEKTNQALQDAIDVLSKGATEEIIKALEIVISDFNKNLTDQFGDNFKQLNTAVVNLLEWQKQFKEIIEKDYDLLIEVRKSLDSSSETLELISTRNKEVTDVYTQLKTLIETYDVQLTSLNKQLESYSNMGREASKAFESLSTGFEKVQSGMGVQSEAIASLTKDIATKLPESLGTLENTLVGLTSQFSKDYKAFLDNYKNLVQ
jgi:uncharacterized protein YukE